MPLFKAQAQHGLMGFIQRYHALRRFKYEALYLKQLNLIQDWQKQAMRARHDGVHSSQQHALIDFFLEEIFLGLDLSEISEHADQAILKILKLFHGTDMLSAALEFNALTGEIDEQLTTYIFSEDKAALTKLALTEKDYALAIRHLNLFDELAHQKQLIRDFADGLNDTLQNRLIYQAIKLSGMPAKAMGFGHLHKTVLKGFEILRPLKDAETVIDDMLNIELRYLDELKALADAKVEADD